MAEVQQEASIAPDPRTKVRGLKLIMDWPVVTIHCRHLSETFIEPIVSSLLDDALVQQLLIVRESHFTNHGDFFKIRNSGGSRGAKY